MKKVFLISLLIVVSLVSYICIKPVFSKSKKEGQIIWQKQYNKIIWFNDIQIDNENNIILAGELANDKEDINKTYWHLLKLNTNGKEKEILNINNTKGHLWNLVYNNNYLYLSGTIPNHSENDRADIKILKLNLKTNNVIWELKYDSGSTDYTRSINLDENNNLYVPSFNSYTIKLNGKMISQGRWFINRYNTNLKKPLNNFRNIIFDEKTKGSITDSLLDKDGNIYIVGDGLNLIGDSYFDSWLKKYNYNGIEDTAWEKKFDANKHQNSIEAIAIDSQQNIFVAGFGTFLVSPDSKRDWWIKKYDRNGNEDTIHWDIKVDGNNGSDQIVDIAIDKNDNLYVVGIGKNIVHDNSGEDWWIKKYDKNGKEDVNWDIKIDGNRNDDDVPKCIAIDNNGDIIVAGYGRDLISILSEEDWKILKDPDFPNEIKRKIARKASGFDAWVIKFKGPEQ